MESRYFRVLIGGNVWSPIICIPNEGLVWSWNPTNRGSTTYKVLSVEWRHYELYDMSPRTNSNYSFLKISSNNLLFA